MKKIKTLLLTGALVCFSISWASFAYSAEGDEGDEGGGTGVAEQPCDTNVWNQMSARGWLEAEREVQQNQNLIFKPDSVFEYTCFSDLVDIASSKGGDIFVHTDYFGPKIIPRGANPHAMEVALTEVVAKAMENYQNNNFDHSFLGGRADKMAATESDFDLRNFASATNSAYTCKSMAAIWQTAKCANFVDNSNFENQDGFYPFANLKGHAGGLNVKGYTEINDVRLLPTACGGPGGEKEEEEEESSGPPSGLDVTAAGGEEEEESGPVARTWEAQLKLAKNEEEKYQFQTPLKQIFTDVNMRLKPGACQDPILTGISIMVDGKNIGPDGVCTNAGCTYSVSGGEGESGGDGGDEEEPPTGSCS